jgi:Holliday junction resolvasome RuvABC endonuclease subunit
VSDPCIEFWFILHFTFCRSPFSRKGKKSPGECAVDQLKKYVPEYGKANKDELEKLIPRTPEAIVNSKKALADALATGNCNPSTRVHDLIERISLEANK